MGWKVFNFSEPTINLHTIIKMCDRRSLAQHHAVVSGGEAVRHAGPQDQRHHHGGHGPGQDLWIQPHLPLLCLLHIPLQLPHAQSLCCRHHGQL